MKDLNSLLLEGNVVRDPICRQTSAGKEICTFSLAANRFYKNAEGEFDKEVSYFDIEAWGKLAETCSKNCPKGRGVRVVGRLKQNRWVGTDGRNYSRVTVVAEHVEFKPVFAKKEEILQEKEDVDDKNIDFRSMQMCPEEAVSTF